MPRTAKKKEGWTAAITSLDFGLLVLWLLELVLAPVVGTVLLCVVVVIGVPLELAVLLLGGTEFTIVEVDGLFAMVLDDEADPSGVK